MITGRRGSSDPDTGIPKGRRTRLLAVAGLLATLAMAAVTVRVVSVHASGCADDIKLRLVATPEIAPVLKQVGEAWQATDPRVSGRCIRLTVDAAASATVAGALTGSGTGAVEVPPPSVGTATAPDVWIPDSSSWLARVQAVDRTAFAAKPRSIATSPIVLAMPEAAARSVGWPDRGMPPEAVRQMLSGTGALRLVLADPRRETASLVVTLLLGEAFVTSEEELPALVKAFRGVARTQSTAELLRVLAYRRSVGPASEQAVLTHAAAATEPAVRVVAVPFESATPQLDYPFAVRASL